MKTLLGFLIVLWTVVSAPPLQAADKILGAGTTGFVTKFTDTAAIGNSLLFDNGLTVDVNGALHVTSDLDVLGDATFDDVIVSDELAVQGNVAIGSSVSVLSGSRLHVVQSVFDPNNPGDFRPALTVESIDPLGAPLLTLYFNPPDTPQPGHQAGVILFSSNDDSTTQEVAQAYATISAPIADPTDGAEDGSLIFATVKDGDFGVRMIINSEGNVGIGTDEPHSGLDVLPDALFREDVIVEEDIEVQGSVGIGTDEPLARLHIVQTDDKPAAALFLESFSSVSGPILAFDNNTPQPAGIDMSGFIGFGGRNDAGEPRQTAVIRADLADSTTNLEVGLLTLVALSGDGQGGTELTPVTIGKGYIQIPTLTTVLGPPPDEDCNEFGEIGRIRGGTHVLWVCDTDGWRFAELTPPQP